MIFKISVKTIGEISCFFSSDYILLDFAKEIKPNHGFRGKCHFSAKNWQNSLKNVIITSAPGTEKNWQF
jgi:hypothetical protein